MQQYNNKDITILKKNKRLHNLILKKIKDFIIVP